MNPAVYPIELAGQHRPDLCRLHVARVALERRSQLALDRLALLRPVEEHGQVVGLFANRGGQRAVALEPAPPLQDLLGRGLIFPEVGRGGLGFDVGQFAREAGFVKVPSARRRRARKGR